ncbi:MAG: hypothetical protein Q9196_003712, partial [Gyalolechia fulgens]
MNPNIASKPLPHPSKATNQVTVPPETNPNYLSPSADPRPYVYTALRRKATSPRRAERAKVGETPSRITLFEESTSEPETPTHDRVAFSGGDDPPPRGEPHGAPPPPRKFINVPEGKREEILAVQDELLATQDRLLQAQRAESEARLARVTESSARKDGVIARLREELGEARAACAQYEDSAVAAAEGTEKLRGLYAEALLALRKWEVEVGLWREVGRFSVNMVKMVLMLGILVALLMVLVFGLLRVERVLFR